MSIAQRIQALKATPAPRPPSWLRAGADNERYNLPDLAASEAQALLYTKLAWLQIAVAALAQHAATTALQVQQRKGEGLAQIVNHPFELLLQRPNPMQSRFELLEATFSWRKVAGNCYWWLNRSGPGVAPSEIWIVPAHQIEPVPDGQLFIRGYRYDSGMGQQIPLEPWEIVHFKAWNPLNKYVGLSLVQSIAMDAQADIAAARYAANFYAKDNAKAAGILAFADAIDNDRWARLKADWSEQHGGTQQKRMMLLRNVGAGGVQWIRTQLSQAETEYLQQRTFTKEEIFNLVAPGLASILAVNATEANSTAGKDTFLSMAVYPQQVAVAEKITNDLLPSYGDDLVASFDDVRRADTEIELKQRLAYERSHTIDEVRARYDGDGPIGDARGALLPGEVGRPMPAAPDLAVAGKALDRRRWRDKATKAALAGRSLDVAFEPEYLGDDEAMVIRAALKRARTRADVVAAFGGE